MTPFTTFLSQIGAYCEEEVSSIISDMVCSFPDWAADKLYAPIEAKIEAAGDYFDEQLHYEIKHYSQTSYNHEETEESKQASLHPSRGTSGYQPRATEIISCMESQIIGI